MVQSSVVKPQALMVSKILVSNIRLEIFAALGMPVVPPVNSNITV